MFHWIQDSAGWIAGVAAGLTALGLVLRWIKKRADRFSRKFMGAIDALIGREEITHPDTGKVLVPATPGLGQRLASIEENLTILSDTRKEMQNISSRVDEMQRNFEQHLTASEEAERARTEEREQMWSTINAALQAEPPQWDGAERRKS